MDYMSFHITDNGIEFIFQAYTLGGPWTVPITVPYVNLRGILNPQLFPGCTDDSSLLRFAST